MATKWQHSPQNPHHLDLRSSKPSRVYSRDADTNWYTITAFRDLAVNVVGSVIKGQRVVVTGTLRVRDWASGERTGTNVEVDAETIGHDLRFGTSTFIRSVKYTAEEVAPSDTVA